MYSMNVQYHSDDNKCCLRDRVLMAVAFACVDFSGVRSVTIMGQSV